MNEKLLHYISTTTSWQIKKLQTYTKASITLPIQIFYKFDLVKYRLEDLEILCLFAKDDACDSKLLARYTKLIVKDMDIPIVFIFEECEAIMIQKMIKQKINFIVIDKYIFLPFALMNINTKEIKKTLTSIPTKLDNISKTIIIAYLSAEIEATTTGAEIAKKLSKQPIVISKALHQLESLEYLSFKKSGRKKLVNFIDKAQMWKRCKYELYTPIKKRVFINSQIDKNLFVTSGISALAKHSNLAKDPKECVAIYKREFNSIKDRLHFTDKEDALYEVEVWDIDPRLLSADAMVNPLYLVINFLYEEDERVVIAIEEMIKRFDELSFLKGEVYA
jgi:hypothetical protein